MEFPIVGKSYQLGYPQLNDQQCVNYYLVNNGDGMTKNALVPTPGYTLFTTLTGAYVRSGFVYGEYAYVVSGNTLFKVRRDGVFFNIGTLETNTGFVYFTASQEQICLVDGMKGYVVTIATDAFTTITEPSFPTTPVYITFQDGFFIVTDNEGNFRTSTANDALTGYDNQISPQYQGDKVLAVVSNRDLLVIVKEKSTEFYQNTGTETIFEKLNQTSSNYGCAAKNTIALCDESLVYLSRSKVADAFVVKVSSYEVAKLSDEGIDQVLSTIGSLDGAYAFSWVYKGHLYYQLTIPNAERTFLYDFATESWTELSSKKVTSRPVQYGRHTASCFMNLNGIPLIGDYQSPKLFKLDREALTENGEPIRRFRRTQATTDENKLTSIYRLEILMNTGCGEVTGTQEAVDPVLMMRYSTDGGRTWSNERTAPMGKIGQFAKRVVFDRLGILRQPVIEISTTSPVDHVILGGYMKGSTGSK